ncbi:MAG: hypothetical protein LBC96_07350 [Lachnospiraceae bacterium]|jgi:hypothetical protein|nr:hypothetical protein [Lachnospiraceae bacterium]
MENKRFVAMFITVILIITVHYFPVIAEDNDLPLYEEEHIINEEDFFTDENDYILDNDETFYENECYSCCNTFCMK